MITVTLGQQDYEITPLPYGPSKAWREQVAIPFGLLAGALRVGGEVELKAGDLGDIAGLIKTFSGILVGAPDMIADLLFAYAPNLEADREYIEANAYDEQIVKAFMEVVKLAYPFTALSNLLALSGRGSPSTSKNSPSPSGGSRRKR